MKKIVAHQTKLNHYQAEACIVWCFDDRFSELLRRFAENHNLHPYDLIKVAGGAKGLTLEGENPERAYILDQIGKSIKLHRPRKVVVMTHADCGAYGRKFESLGEERDFYGAEALKAATAVRSAFPETPVEACFADTEGLHLINN